jgi:O-6-methylguanine DNA methyltransferase
MISFQEKVWQTTAKIPKGKVSTYGLIAKAIKNPLASRAVGQALHCNPHWPKVPCHRVVRGTGEIGGFASGSKKKITLLRQEGIEIENGRILNLKYYLYSFAK